MTEDAPDPTTIVAELQAEVDRRRRSGELPTDIDEQLESRFASLHREAVSRQDFDPLVAALHRQRVNSHFSRERITAESKVPGGAAVHGAVGAVVKRQVDGLLEQMQQFSDAVLATTELLGSMLSDPPFHHHDDLRGDIDVIDDRLVELERRRVEVDVVALQVAELERQLRQAADPAPDLDWGRFAERFRGEPDELRSRYGPMADRFGGKGPVVDFGCGGGDFLSLLVERDVEAWGIEVDEELADAARARGHSVRHGDGSAILADLGNDSLGGIALIQVVEHLAAASLAAAIVEARRVLLPGGILVMETPNPQSLYVHTHSLWMDPSHVRPVHPLYLEHLCVQAGFASVEVSYNSPVPDDQRLEALPDDGSPVSAAANRNIERLNDVLFGPQDAVVIATA